MKKHFLPVVLMLVLMTMSFSVQAESSDANLNVNVLPRKITDTENDFNFEFATHDQGQVLGAEVEKIKPRNINRQFAIFALTNNICLVLLDYYFN